MKLKLYIVFLFILSLSAIFATTLEVSLDGTKPTIHRYLLDYWVSISKS